MPDQADPSPNPQPTGRPRRRTLLLLALLASLIGLLVGRPDLRRPAARATAHAGHVLAVDALGLSPRRIYAWRLWLAGLYDAPLGQRWRSAADHAQPQVFQHRLHLSFDFKADRITARVVTTHMSRGMAIAWRLSRSQTGTGRLFAELQRATGGAPDREWTTVATLDADGHKHHYTVATDGRYRLVFQPELSARVHAKLAVARGGSLSFPVVGGHEYDIGGGFGVPRAGGKRRHKGVDIFADRDTPVRAVVSGHVSTGNGGLGGHYIFLSSGLAGPRYYYAHLDHFAVDDGTHVDKGDVIGYVGNSGNAAGGPTHLHFGIYTAGGAIDPAPFIQPMPALPGG